MAEKVSRVRSCSSPQPLGCEACVFYHCATVKRLTDSADQLLELVRLGPVSFHDAPDPDEGHQAQQEEDEADGHVQRQWHKDQQRPGRVKDSDETDAR